jgi:hypothetical protein
LVGTAYGAAVAEVNETITELMLVGTDVAFGAGE